MQHTKDNASLVPSYQELAWSPSLPEQTRDCFQSKDSMDEHNGVKHLKAMFRVQVQVAKKTNFYGSLPSPSGFDRFAPIRGSGKRWKSHRDCSERASPQRVFSALQCLSLTTTDFPWCFKAGACVHKFSKSHSSGFLRPQPPTMDIQATN